MTRNRSRTGHCKTRRQAYLSLKPQDINETVWYYESRGALTLVHEIRDFTTDCYIRTDQIKIPWSKLLDSAKRCRPELFYSSEVKKARQKA